MRKAYIITFLAAVSCIFCFSQAMAQGSSNFGASRPQDSSITRAQLVLKAYATALPNMFLRVNTTGHVVLDTVETNTLVGGYGLVTSGDTVSLDTALLNGAYLKLGDSVITYVTPYELAQAISNIPNIDTTSLSNRINQKLDTVAFGLFHRTYFDTSRYGYLLLSMFGDSFTVGSNATGFDSSYAGMFHKMYGLPLVNYAKSGAGLKWACIQNSNYINIGNKSVVFVMSGLNDFRLFQTGALDSNKTIRKSINTALFIGANLWSKKVVPAFNGDGVTHTGTWQVVNGKAWGNKSSSAALSTTMNNSIAYAFTDSTLVINVAGCDGETVTYSNYDIYIDGNLYGSFNPNGQTDGGILNAERDSRHPVTHVIRGLPYALHNTEVVNKSNDTLIVDCFSHLKNPDDGCTPYYWAGIPILNNDSTPIAQFISNYRSDSAIRANFYNYPYQRINPSIYYTTPGQDVDGLHPNNLGMKQFIRSIQDSINFTTLPTAAFTVRTYDNNNLMALGSYSIRKVLIDPEGNASFATDRATIAPYSFGSGFTDTNGIQRWIRSSFRPARLYLNNDTTLLQHASNNGSAGQPVTWLPSYRVVANFATPTAFTTELLGNNITLGAANSLVKIGTGSAAIELYGSSLVQGKIGIASLSGPIEHYMYVANNTGAGTGNTGDQFKYVRFYPATQRTAIRTFNIRATAHLHLGGGLATAGGAFLKFHDSLLLTTAEKGAWGYRNNSLFFTPSTAWRRFVLTDTIPPTSGQIPIGNSEGNYTNASLIGSNGVSITNGSGLITVGLSQAGIIPTAVDISATSITATSNLSLTRVITTRYVDATAGNITITIYPSTAGQMIKIKRLDNSGNTVTVQGASGQIDGTASVVIPPAVTERPTLSMQFDGTNYLIY